MASPQHPTTIQNLPGEVLAEIFVRLLAKEVAQMRCVSRSWSALLSDSSFIKSHLHHSIQNNDEILLFYGMVFSYEFGPSPFAAHPSCSPDLELSNFIKPPLIPQTPQTPQSRYGCGFLIGSMNGLICFCYKYSLGDYLVHIWNPSLSALLTLPPSSLPFNQLHFGFGFDPKSDDYKIVKLTTFSGSKQAEVYPVRHGSWKPISQSFPSHIKTHAGQHSQICVDDNLHWLCDTDFNSKPQTIVRFDLSEDAYVEIPLPETLFDFKLYECFTVLGVLGGKLCVITRVRDCGKFEVWVMGDYGVADSWVKHHVFSQFGGDIIPYGFTSHDEFLFQVGQDDDCFGLYDPITANIKTFKIMSKINSIMSIAEYIDSLVWVAPPKHEISSCDISRLEIGQSEKRKQKTSAF